MFDPSKRYQWNPEEKIEFTGREFLVINDAMQQFITSNLDVPTILKLTQAYAVVFGKMNEYIDKGLITEHIDTKIETSQSD